MQGCLPESSSPNYLRADRGRSPKREYGVIRSMLETAHKIKKHHTHSKEFLMSLIILFI